MECAEHLAKCSMEQGADGPLFLASKTHVRIQISLIQ
jgi:hypothetical protein